MATIISALPTLIPSRNTSVITLRDEANTVDPEYPAEIEAVLECEQEFLSDSFTKVAEFLNPYSHSENMARVSINNALTASLSQNPPDFLQEGLQEINGACKRFRIKARNINDGVPLPTFQTSSPFYALKAGTPYPYPELPTDGAAYLLLTSLPLVRWVAPEELICFCFLPLSSGNAHIRLKFLKEDTESITDNIESISLTAFQPYYYNFTFPETESPFVYVELSVHGLTGTAPKIRFNLFRKSPNFLQVFFANSKGGFDSFPMTGRKILGMEPQSTTFESQLLNTNPTADTLETTAAEARDFYVLRTPYLTESEILALRDMILRNQLYALKNGILHKLIIEKKQFNILEDDKYDYAIEFKADMAYIQKAY